MRKIIAIFLFLLAPLLVYGAAGNVIVNNQSTYAVPGGTTRLLILDLTLPENLTSIKISNLGTAQQSDISAIYILEDGLSSGFDGDENEIARKTSFPFWDEQISANSSNPRIFITVDIVSGVGSGRTIQPQATINLDKTITGVERTVVAGASIPDVPQAPLAMSGEALSATTIRWKFLDTSNNEFGFRIKDGSLKTKAEVLQIDLSYIDETGLSPNTCYSNRRVVALNDRGEGLTSANFVEVCTPKTPPIEAPVVPQPPAEQPPVIEEPVVEAPPVEAPIIKTPPAKEPVAKESVIKKPAAEAPEEIKEPSKVDETSGSQEISETESVEKTSLFKAIRNFFSKLFSFLRGK